MRVRLGPGFVVRHHGDYMQRIKAGFFSGFCFDNFTTEAIGYGEASEQNLPVFLMKETNPKRVAEQYIRITDEFLERLS